MDVTSMILFVVEQRNTLLTPYDLIKVSQLNGYPSIY